jgi:hypothetical protein
MESKKIMKRNLQFYKLPNCKYECIAFIMPNREYICNADMNELYKMEASVSKTKEKVSI